MKATVSKSGQITRKEKRAGSKAGQTKYPSLSDPIVFSPAKTRFGFNHSDLVSSKMTNTDHYIVAGQTHWLTTIIDIARTNVCQSTNVDGISVAIIAINAVFYGSSSAGSPRAGT